MISKAMQQLSIVMGTNFGCEEMNRPPILVRGHYSNIIPVAC